MEKLSYKKGEQIFKEGSYESCMYLIESGAVNIYRSYGRPEERLLTELVPGRFFGELGLLEASPRSADAVASEDTIVIKIGPDSLRDYFHQQPEKAIELFSSVIARLKELSVQHTELQELIDVLNGSTISAKEKINLLEKFMMRFAAGKKQDVAAEVRTAINSNAEIKHLQAKSGSVICREGETENWMYELGYGSAAVYSGYGTAEQRKLTVLTEGSTFGEIGMIEHSPRTATVVALEDCELRIITEEAFYSYFGSRPAQAFQILSNAASRVRALSADVAKDHAALEKFAK